MRNIAGKKRARQGDVDSGYLFARESEAAGNQNAFLGPTLCFLIKAIESLIIMKDFAIQLFAKLDSIASGLRRVWRFSRKIRTRRAVSDSSSGAGPETGAELTLTNCL